MATNEQLKLTIEVAARNAVRELQDTAREAKKVGEAVEEIDPQEVVRAFDRATDMLIDDLKAAERAADALGDALGPELRDSLGDAHLDSFIADLRQAGLTFDQIEQNADDFAGSLRKMDGAASSVKGVEGKLRAMNSEGDNSRNVLANMVGNSAQDIGQLAGITGTAGVALGQMAEYAADGNIKLSNLAKVAGPMAGMAVAMWAVEKGAAQAAKRSREFSEAVRDLSRATDEQVLRSLGAAMMRAALDGESLTDQFRDMAEANLEGTKRLRDVALEAGYTRDQLKLLEAAIANEEKAIKQAEETHRKYGGTMDAVAAKGRGFNGTLTTMKGLLKDLSKGVEIPVTFTYPNGQRPVVVGGGAGQTPDGERSTTRSTTNGGATINVYPRVMPTEREFIDMANKVTRRQGPVI